MRASGRIRLRVVFFVGVVLCVFSPLIYMHAYKLLPKYAHAFQGDVRPKDWPQLIIVDKKTAEKSKKNVLNSGKCTLPNLIVDDPSLTQFFKDVPQIDCPGESWVNATDGKFLIDPGAVNKHGKITCDYKDYFRVTDHKINFHLKRDFKSETPLDGDYFTANCHAEDGTSSNEVISTIIPKNDVIERCRKAEKAKDLLGLNVYMFGFDSISRMTFQRKMKKTYKYLVENLHAAVLQGYNIVGDGTPQAFIPILTGKTEEELPLTRKRFANANYVNIYPMIWKEYEKAGYATMYGEDASHIGTFTYRLKGFKEQPTDHYYRTFYSLLEDYRWIKGSCVGNQPQHVQYLRYGYEFMTSYPSDVKKFGVLFHSLLSHGDINTVQAADQDTLNHMQMLDAKGVFNNSIFIFMADHGHRFAEFRATQQGQLEERLPFFSFVAPQWFREKHKLAWQNMLDNRYKLTTPFDIHATLMHLLHWREPKIADISQRSLSLWDEIPATRSCADAGIAPHWCTCLAWRDLHTTDYIAILVAKSVTEAINRETFRERSLCSKLKFVSLEMAKLQAPDDSVLKYQKAKDYDGFVPDLSGNTKITYSMYQIRFRTQPGNSLYEATVNYDARLGPGSKSQVVVNLNDVSHINKYGDNPHCVIDKDYFLAKWCVCYDKI